MGHDKLFQKKQALTRRENTRKIRRILIVCEGEKTEPNYFKKFPENPEVYDRIDIHGTGYNTVSLIKEAIRLKNEAHKRREPYIEVWCVFDKDDFSISSFNEAIRLATVSGLRCAYSIEAFELWYMLHFNYYDMALSRTQYIEKLSEFLKKTYLKNDENMYELLESRQAQALQNAHNLYKKQNVLPLKKQNPVTIVFKLVERLLG
jgi:hypothetical protein